MTLRASSLVPLAALGATLKVPEPPRPADGSYRAGGLEAGFGAVFFTPPKPASGPPAPPLPPAGREAPGGLRIVPGAAQGTGGEGGKATKTFR